MKRDFKNYLEGFSENIRNIINKFNFYAQIHRSGEQDRLGLLIEKFCDSRINLSDNNSMGTLFEEVIRMFNDQTNVTDAGQHFTLRDIVQLMADLAFIPIQDKIERIYDGTCGTGGMLTVGELRIIELAESRDKDVSILSLWSRKFCRNFRHCMCLYALKW